MGSIIKNRNILIDVLKGIAIIAVVLYHLGVSEFGYLGVDVFFVISGYLVAIGLIKNFNNSKFSYWEYLNKRLSRLWPGLIIISIIALILGWKWMLPLHFKLDCESIVGTCLYGNNIIQYITSGDYWMADNEFKPLMHTWYVGILMQFYLIVPMVFYAAKKCKKQWNRSAFYILMSLSLLSFLIFVSPVMTYSQDFYLLPARFFELGVGALLAIILMKSDGGFSPGKAFHFCMLLILAVILIFCPMIEAAKLRLLATVALSVVMIWCSNYITLSGRFSNILYPISFMGVASYSLYLSHQVFFAFYRYIESNVFSIVDYLHILCATIVLGLVMYFLLEKPLTLYLNKRKSNMYLVNGLSFIVVIGIVSVALHYYKQDGLVRDIPELDLYVGENNLTPEDYNSRIFAYDNDFKDNGKPNILVIGDSFGRDWINVLIESGVDSLMNISYRTQPDEITQKRILNADYIFLANNGSVFTTYSKILPLLMNKNYYRVGIKGFGYWAGQVYNNDRYGNDYFNQTIEVTPFVNRINEEEKTLFGEHYIDMMCPIKVDNANILIFTPGNKLISQDCLHFTKAGAKMYAEKLDVWQYLK